MSAAVCGLQVCALLTLARHNYHDGGAGPWFLVPRCEDTSLFWRSCPATAAPPSPRVLYTGANTQVLPFLFLAHSVRHNFLQRTEKEGPLRWCFYQPPYLLIKVYLKILVLAPDSLYYQLVLKMSTLSASLITFLVIMGYKTSQILVHG